MKVYIANFGRENWAWPDCLSRSALAVMLDQRTHSFWQAGDREGYIAAVQEFLRNASGERITRPVGSRWFNVNTIFVETAGDLWIHRERDELWWTISCADPAERELVEDPKPLPGSRKVYIYYKLCSGWANRDRQGRALSWSSLHPRAKEFLFTEAALQKPAADHAAYAQALINGDDLSPWHSRSDWQARAEKARHGAVRQFDARELTVARMAIAAFEAEGQSGSISQSVRKDKEVRFRNRFELESYITTLLREQENLCALTGIELKPDAEQPDPDLRCSLDRIDSNGHYEMGNLQVVCWFANRWKGASDVFGDSCHVSQLEGAVERYQKVAMLR